MLQNYKLYMNVVVLFIHPPMLICNTFHDLLVKNNNWAVKERNYSLWPLLAVQFIEAEAGGCDGVLG